MRDFELGIEPMEQEDKEKSSLSCFLTCIQVWSSSRLCREALGAFVREASLDYFDSTASTVLSSGSRASTKGQRPSVWKYFDGGKGVDRVSLL